MRNNPRKIMCAVDFSDYSPLVLAYGRTMASEFHSTLYLCHVVPEPVLVANNLAGYIEAFGTEAQRIEAARTQLEKMAEDNNIPCEFLISTGHPADEIERLATENNMDMVIAATHGDSGIKRFLIGSVTSRLVKTLTCPILVLHASENKIKIPFEERFQLERILVGCDFSPDSRLAFDYALSLAQEFQTRLYLAHVIKPDSRIWFSASDYIMMKEGDFEGWTKEKRGELEKETPDETWNKQGAFYKKLQNQLADLVPEESRNWCSPETVILEGHAYQELLRYAERIRADLIVLGVRGHSMLESFLIGSTTDRVISRAFCPVLAVRQTG